MAVRLHLPFELGVTLDVPGCALPFVGGESRGTLRLPRLRQDEQGWWDIDGWRTPAAQGNVGVKTRYVSPDPNPSWGAAVQSIESKGAPPTGIWLTMLLVEFTEPINNDDERHALSEALQAWIDRLGAWVGSITNQQASADNAPSASVVGERALIWTRSNGAEQVHVPSPTIHLDFTPLLGIDMNDLAFIVERCNDRQDPPLEYMLIASARHSIPHGRRRQAVLDAAAAIELMLSGALRHELAFARPQLADQLLRRKTLGALVYLADLRVVEGSGPIAEQAPPFLNQNDLVEIRNRVAHDGDSPTVREARFLVAAAEAVARTFGTELRTSDGRGIGWRSRDQDSTP